MGIKVNTGNLKEYAKSLKKLQENNLPEFYEKTTLWLAGEVLRRVIKDTPVGKYPKKSGKVGGTLRNGWTNGEKISPSKVHQYLEEDNPDIKKGHKTYRITISNHVEYAPYVEYGHRTGSTNPDTPSGWVDGVFMLTKAVDVVQRDAPAYLESELKKLLEKCFRSGGS